MRRVVLAVLVALIVAMTAAPASATELTPEQKERFIAGSQVTQGWTEAEAEAFLVEHPDLVEGVVIGHRTATTGGGVVSTASTPTIDGIPITTAASAWTPNMCQYGYGVAGTIYSWCMKRYRTYDGVKITYAPGPTITAVCTAYGKVFGCSYKGIIVSYSWWLAGNGQPHWGHYQYREALFSGCYGICGDTPWRWIKVYGNGTWTSSYGW